MRLNRLIGMFFVFAFARSEAATPSPASSGDNEEALCELRSHFGLVAQESVSAVIPMGNLKSSDTLVIYPDGKLIVKNRHGGIEQKISIDPALLPNANESIVVEDAKTGHAWLFYRWGDSDSHHFMAINLANKEKVEFTLPNELEGPWSKIQSATFNGESQLYFSAHGNPLTTVGAYFVSFDLAGLLTIVSELPRKNSSLPSWSAISVGERIRLFYSVAPQRSLALATSRDAPPAPIPFYNLKGEVDSFLAAETINDLTVAGQVRPTLRLQLFALGGLDTTGPRQPTLVFPSVGEPLERSPEYHSEIIRTFATTSSHFKGEAGVLFADQRLAKFSYTQSDVGRTLRWTSEPLQVFAGGSLVKEVQNITAGDGKEFLIVTSTQNEMALIDVETWDKVALQDAYMLSLTEGRRPGGTAELSDLVVVPLSVKNSASMTIAIFTRTVAGVREARGFDFGSDGNYSYPLPDLWTKLAQRVDGVDSNTYVKKFLGYQGNTALLSLVNGEDVEIGVINLPLSSLE